MSLFERLNNKRYDLQEIKKKTSSSASSGNNKSNENISTGRRRIKKAISDLEATQPGGETPIETGRTTFNQNKKKETEESIKAYREAAEVDAWLFGDYDAYEAYDINTKKVSEEDESV